jgi:pyruvate kinase
VCTLGPKSAELSIMEDLLRAGMSVARFNFSHGSHEYHQGTLNTLRQAMLTTRLMCAVLLDTKGPEIRTGMLKGGKPVLMEAGREVTIHTDYTLHGDEHNIAMSYKKLPSDVVPGAEVSHRTNPAPNPHSRAVLVNRKHRIRR